VEAVLAINAVGGIHRAFGPGVLVVPDQLVDYTWGRESTYSDLDKLFHVDFSYPYDAAWRARLFAAAAPDDVIHDFGVYACTQGPRLESAAEIDRLERDGCDLVGMTAMPEATLARELELPYAALCLVVNAGAGRGNGLIEHHEIEAVVASGMRRVEALLSRAITAYPG
jgi:5'-methylthioinosine phosphorylase